jgi:hypothetical protein
VAIRAQENALASLRTKAIDPVRAVAREAKRLRSGVDVVELEGSQAAVVAARLTATSTLSDE